LIDEADTTTEEMTEDQSVDDSEQEPGRPEAEAATDDTEDVESDDGEQDAEP